MLTIHRSPFPCGPMVNLLGGRSAAPLKSRRPASPSAPAAGMPAFPGFGQVFRVHDFDRILTQSEP